MDRIYFRYSKKSICLFIPNSSLSMQHGAGWLWLIKAEHYFLEFKINLKLIVSFCEIMVR